MGPSPRTCYFIAYGILGGIMIMTNFVIVPTLVQMIAYSSTILYIACHHSLSMFDKDPETGEQAEIETVSRNDAMLFPVFGSIALFSMYVAYKFFGKEIVNLLLGFYLTVLGNFALAESLRPVMVNFVPEAWSKRSIKFQFTLPFGAKNEKAEAEPIKIAFGYVDIVDYVLAAALSAVYVYTKHWCIHNLFAVSFCLQGVALISLGKFYIGMILLVGLFFYDIFWVFGTEVMVSVATQFTGPIKIIFPVSFDPWKQSILGLGDIVLPGMFLAMTLRFDAFLHQKQIAESEQSSIDFASSFTKTYFRNSLLSYVASLLLCGCIMFYFKAAQPALLYLVPGILLTFIGTSLATGQLSEMMAYNEEELSPKKDPPKEKES